MQKKIQELKPTKIITGIAIGVDTIAAELAIELKIPFIAAVPFLNQDLPWKREDRFKYKHLLTQALEVKYVCGPGYASWKFQKRNEYIVDNCNELCAVYDGSSGGTANCIKYAQLKKKTIHFINPKSL